MGGSYMKEQGEAPAQHLKLTEGTSGYVEVTDTGFRAHIRRKWPGKQPATWDGLPVR